MARGAPDYGIYAVRIAPIVGLSDIGEGAVRLGAIDLWDRRGFVIFQDDFESPTLLWDTEKEGSGEYPILNSDEVCMGSQSCYLSAPIAADSESRLTRIFPLLKKGRLGFEFWIQARAYTDGYFWWRLWEKDGVNIAFAELRFDSEAKNITIRTSTGYVEVLTDIYTTQGDHFFLPIKIVIDTNTDKYVRLLVGSVEVDLSAYSLRDMGDTTDHNLNVKLGCLGCALDSMFTYVDNFILTQDEP